MVGPDGATGAGATLTCFRTSKEPNGESGHATPRTEAGKERFPSQTAIGNTRFAILSLRLRTTSDCRTIPTTPAQGSRGAGPITPTLRTPDPSGRPRQSC